MKRGIRVEQLNEKISFGVKPVNEFGIIATQYFEREEHFKLIKEHNISIEPRIFEIINIIDSKLSPFMKSEKEFFKRTKSIRVAIWGFIDDYEEVNTVEDYFKVFDNSPDEELFNFIGGAFIAQYNKEDNSAWGKVKHSMTLMREYINNLEDIEKSLVDDILSLFDSPQETRMRLRYLIHTFYSIYKDFEQEVMERVILETKILQKKFEEDPKKFYEEHFFKGLIDITKTKVQIIVSYTFVVGWSVNNNNPEKLILTYGYKGSEYLKSKNLTEHLDKFLKLVSDKTRQKILVILSQEERYAQSLAKELGLTPATINYHLQNFLIIGLVDVNERDNKTYYKLNKDIADKYIELLRTKLNL
ncbi:MAG: winged helix-turn-helix transcriptional regulator [Clostridium sp.]|nr:winged helix-turn-helix transcriptional regulator [Clostridium sp.]MBQ9012657.1 winged helix-turn-helix transcriptional regulator [Bacilli bacterium]